MAVTPTNDRARVMASRHTESQGRHQLVLVLCEPEPQTHLAVSGIGAAAGSRLILWNANDYPIGFLTYEEDQWKFTAWGRAGERLSGEHTNETRGRGDHVIEQWDYERFPDEFDAMIEHVEGGNALVLARNDEPVAVIMPYEMYAKYEDMATATAVRQGMPTAHVNFDVEG